MRRNKKYLNIPKLGLPIISLNISYHVTDDVGVSPDNKNKLTQDLASSVQ
jgi:hypothetical protein